jgi:hypothetical protein
VPGFREKLARDLHAMPKMGSVKGTTLALQANACCLDEALEAAAATVRDGLASLANTTDCAPGATGDFGKNSGKIRESELLKGARIIDLTLPGESRTCARDFRMSFQTLARAFALSLKSGRMHSMDEFWGRANQARDGDRFLMQNASIPTATYKISLLPHTRRSVRMETLKDAEYKGFLREAEVLKGIPAERAELLAVFRHVPIEIISRLRYVAENRLLVFSISRQSGPTSTRLHDMAAVRDIMSQDIYLIPHRTRFRAVSLN